MLENGLPLPRLGQVVRQPGMPLWELYNAWAVTMQNYSARSLTRSGDKLAALAGVTQLFQRAVKDEPLAGLWKKDLYGGLLWRVPINTHAEPDLEAMRTLNIPSWSWLKVRGSVDSNQTSIEACAEISSAFVSWTGLPLVSKINDASITGRGKLLRIHDLRTDKGDACMCRVRRFRLESPSDEPLTYYKIYCFMDECASEIKDTLSFLPIHIERPRRASPYTMTIHALIIATGQSSHSTSIYRRVGVAYLEELPQRIFENSQEVNFTLM